jgi:hypothetical protein
MRHLFIITLHLIHLLFQQHRQLHLLQPSLNDTIVENFDNDAGNERVTMIWKYNGTTWVALGHPEYHPMHFFDIVGANVNVGSPPLTPANFGTDVETTYIPGDTVWEDYNDGFIYWQVDSGGLWQIGSMVVYPAGGGGGSGVTTTLGLVASFNNASVPTAPTVAPSSPTTGDVYIETFNNTTGNQRVIMRWTYNGTTWVLNGVPEYNIRSFMMLLEAHLIFYLYLRLLILLVVQLVILQATLYERNIIMDTLIGFTLHLLGLYVMRELLLVLNNKQHYRIKQRLIRQVYQQPL